MFAGIRLQSGILLSFIVSAALMPFAAHAQLTLTPAGTGDGFTLTNFVTGFPGDPTPAPNSCCGPMGVATMANGNVLVYNTGNNSNYVFTDVNGQTASAALNVALLPTPFFPPGATTAGGLTYENNGYGPSGSYGGAGGALFQVNPTGTVGGTPVLSNTTTDLFTALGLATDPANGDIISSGATGVYDITPGSFATRKITSTTGDGVSVSPDGLTGYLATGGCVQSFSIGAGALGAKFCEGSSDGTGVIDGGTFNDYIVANNNDGTMTLIDPTLTTGVQIASGGSRGDYTGVDPTNGTLFITQTDSVQRLSCPNCSFSAPMPEPASSLLFGVGVIGVAIFRRRRVA